MQLSPTSPQQSRKLVAHQQSGLNASPTTDLSVGSTAATGHAVLSLLPSETGDTRLSPDNRTAPAPDTSFGPPSPCIAHMPVELMEKIGALLDDPDLLALAATCRPVRQRLGAVLLSVDLRRRMEASLTGSGLSQAMDDIDKNHPPARKALWATAVAQVSKLPPADAAQALDHAHQRLWSAHSRQPAAGRAGWMSALFQQLAARLASLADEEQFRQSALMLDRWARAWPADEFTAQRYQPDDLLFDVDEPVLHRHYDAYVHLSGKFPPDRQSEMLASLPLPDLQRLAPAAQQAAIEKLMAASSTLQAAARTLLLHRLDWTVAGLLHLPDQDGMRGRIADLLSSGPG